MNDLRKRSILDGKIITTVSPSLTVDEFAWPGGKVTRERITTNPTEITSPDGRHTALVYRRGSARSFEMQQKLDAAEAEVQSELKKIEVEAERARRALLDRTAQVRAKILAGEPPRPDAETPDLAAGSAQEPAEEAETASDIHEADAVAYVSREQPQLRGAVKTAAVRRRIKELENAQA